MLAFLESWLKNLIVVILLISMVKIIMPTGKIRSYVRFILSLVVMLLIVQPFIEFIKGSDYLVNTWLTEQRGIEMSENRVYTMAQTINDNKEALTLYKERLKQQLEHDLKLITNNKVIVTKLLVNEDVNSKQFGYVSDIAITVIQENVTDHATEVMTYDKSKHDTDIKELLYSNYGNDKMRIKISQEGEG